MSKALNSSFPMKFSSHAAAHGPSNRLPAGEKDSGVKDGVLLMGNSARRGACVNSIVAATRESKGRHSYLRIVSVATTRLLGDRLVAVFPLHPRI